MFCGGFLFKKNNNFKFAPITDTDTIAKIITPNNGNRHTDNYLQILYSDAENTQAYSVYSADNVSTTIQSSAGGVGAKTGLYEVKGRIRKLTPLEVWRLFGFSESDYNKIRPYFSDSRIYMLCGNSITVNVLEFIFYNLFKSDYPNLNNPQKKYLKKT